MPIDLTLLTKHGYFNHRVAAVIVKTHGDGSLVLKSSQ